MQRSRRAETPWRLLRGRAWDTCRSARIQDGQLGNIIEVSTRRTAPFPIRPTDVGVVYDLATHDFDLTPWLTSQHYTTIAARTAHHATSPHEDLLTALGQLSNGTIAHHQANRISPLTQRTLIITGQNGYLVADTLTSSLTYLPNPPGTHPAPHRAGSPEAIHSRSSRPSPSGPSTKPSATPSSATTHQPPRCTRPCTPS